MDAHNPSKNRSTVEVYRDLLQVEVKSLIGRVAELTDTVGNLFIEINGIALQIEQTVDRIGQVNTGLDYCREEIKTLRVTVTGYGKQLEDIRKKMQSTEEKLKKINGKSTKS